MPRGKRNNYNYYYPQRSLAVGKKNKYSTMTFYLTNPAPNPASLRSYITVVNPANISGMRKVKNISIQLAFESNWIDSQGVIQTSGDMLILWAIVYVPKGSEPGVINKQTGILYSPPQFIMASGVYDTTQPGNSSRIFTPLSRNLNEGDGIAFVYRSSDDEQIQAGQLKAMINYAITLQ